MSSSSSFFVLGGKQIKSSPAYSFTIFPKTYFSPRSSHRAAFFFSLFTYFWLFIVVTWSLCVIFGFLFLQIMSVMTVVCGKKGVYLDISPPTSSAYRKLDFHNPSQTERDFLHLNAGEMHFLLPM